MTTYILGQKLMTIKLDKREIAKVSCLKKIALEEKHKIISSLQQIISKQSSEHTCRLCLRPGRRKIFQADSTTNIATDIKYVLGIEISEMDGLPQYICSSCEETVTNAAQLKQTAEITQWRLQQELQMVSEAAVDIDEPLPKKHHGGCFSVKGPTIVREWACGKCPKKFQSEGDFAEHEKQPLCRRRRNKLCVCEICGRELKSLFLLKRHRLTHTDEPGEFPCSYCSYRGRTKYAVTVHERWHTGARPLRCSLCGKGFPNASNLWAHGRTHLPPSHHCVLCAKSFRFKQLLKDHIASQHGTEKCFNCSACGKAFATRRKALRHERRVHNRPRMRDLEKTYLKETNKDNASGPEPLG